MSGRPPRYPPPKPAVQEEPEEEEELDEDMDEEGFDEVDMFDALGGLLATEEGETVAQALVGIKESTEKIALHMEMQNKVLVKIVAALQKMGSDSAPPAPSA